jgi:hypothetical protein
MGMVNRAWLRFLRSLTATAECQEKVSHISSLFNHAIDIREVLIAKRGVSALDLLVLCGVVLSTCQTQDVTIVYQKTPLR